MRTTATLLAAALLLTAACSDDGDDAGETGSAPPADEEPAATVPEGAEPGGANGGLFVEIASVGGFLPANASARQLPMATVYADGTVFAPGAITLQFPGPAVLPFFTGRLDAAEVDDLLADAAEAGLLGEELDVGGQGDIPVGDATTTRITVVVDGAEHVVEAYALYEADGSTLAEDQARVRAGLVDFVGAVTEAAVAAQDPYEPERYRVVAADATDANVDVEPPPNELAWPAGLPEPVLGGCVVVAGEQAGALEALLPQASEITRWLVGGRAASLAIRPLLPHDPDCPDKAGG